MKIKNSRTRKRIGYLLLLGTMISFPLTIMYSLKRISAHSWTSLSLKNICDNIILLGFLSLIFYYHFFELKETSTEDKIIIIGSILVLFNFLYRGFVYFNPFVDIILQTVWFLVMLKLSIAMIRE